MKTVRVAIVGAAGVAAGKLIKILLGHGGIRLSLLTDIPDLAGRPIDSIHTVLRGRLSMPITPYDHAALATEADIAFFATPHGFAMRHAGALLDAGLTIIDLSGDHRLKDTSAFREWYGMDHETPGILKKSVYGLPEFYRDAIKKARLIANPGCYPTSVILGAAPLLKSGRARAHVIANSVSGASGAGRGNPQNTQLIDLVDNIRPYKVGSHQHIPEMEQELTKASSRRTRVLFVPHVGGYRYGIITSLFLTPTGPLMTTEDAISLYRRTYDGEPFVRVLPGGKLPQISDVEGTNFCDIGVTADKRTRTYIVTTVIDNIIKGASGQAVQNMNILRGFPETQGLL